MKTYCHLTSETRAFCVLQTRWEHLTWFLMRAHSIGTPAEHAKEHAGTDLNPGILSSLARFAVCVHHMRMRAVCMCSARVNIE